MARRLTLPLCIDMTMQRHTDNPISNETMDTQVGASMSPRHERSQSVSEIRISAPLHVRVNSKSP